MTFKYLKMAGVVCLGLLSAHCSKDEAPSMANVQLTMSQYTNASYKAEPFFLKYIIPTAYATISSGSLKFCFKRLRLKPVEDVSDDDLVSDDDFLNHPDNVDFELGEVTLDETGTVLSNITVPAGEYRRIEFDLENHCASGKSISLTNNNGSYYSDERITIRFEGNFSVADGGQVALPVANIIAALNAFNPSNPADQAVISSELKEAAEVIGEE